MNEGSAMISDEGAMISPEGELISEGGAMVGEGGAMVKDEGAMAGEDDSATLSFRSVEDMQRKLRALAESWGWIVITPGDEEEWTTPREICQQYGIRLDSLLSRAWRARDIPPFTAERGASGRLVKLKPNPELRRWLAARFIK